ncbi:hypothetical protein [Shinella sp.]|uniref:hypothetical protein n=1 Tax=Shinella sp. TaxID=1870904 RepID=UPI00258D1071|nr:hypothetical protein [Shinella sp.]MCW5710637.1 hypothetical protein [Shinella sp.]
MQPRIIAVVTAFIATVPLASWLEGNIGMACASGPCIVPVGFGLAGLSSVIAIGASFVLRDAIHEIGGAGVALVAIAIGGILSAMFAAPVLVAASVLAFILAELADFAIYAGLRKRSLARSVTSSRRSRAFTAAPVQPSIPPRRTMSRTNRAGETRSNSSWSPKMNRR